MADITMCKDNTCPKKEQCYRFTANKNEFWQSYFMASPREDEKCNYFWPLEESDEY